MIISVEFSLPPVEALTTDAIEKAALDAAGIVTRRAQCTIHLRRRSIDARQQRPLIVFAADVYVDEEPITPSPILNELKNVTSGPQVIIVGAGPAGYFAALELLCHGIRPIVLDRGKDVRARRFDLRNIQQCGIVDPNSNYCFGEGGAGTYSDGKLYTRSSKRGDVHRVLRLLVEHGAHPDILIDAHPHIGSNKLPQVVSSIRNTILEHGGQVHFDSKVTDITLVNRKAVGVVVNAATEFSADAVVLATGHSARDIYHLCHQKGIKTEFKAFAMGVRVEHPQELIDEIQYKQRPRERALPAASYRLSTQVEGRGVYSFCMCPGGLIVPATTAPGEIVVNGMSMSRRDSRYANSGIVVEIRHDDVEEFHQHGDLAGLVYQQSLEQLSFNAVNDASQRVPAQALVDFCESRLSAQLPSSSYIPGTQSLPVHELLPHSIALRLQRAFHSFGRAMRGYYTNDALVTMIESRTSTPVKIPRDNTTLEHIEIAGLYPCGEGAGYAGGIVSAAMDGQRVAGAISRRLGVD